MEKSKVDDQLIITTTTMYREEATEAKRDRMDQNKVNFDCYNLKQDYAHKIAGQSQEFLAKQHLAVEQISSFIMQGLMDVKDWFAVDVEDGISQEDLFLSPNQVRSLLERQLQKMDFMNTVGDMLKLGLLGSLMIAKVHGKMVPRPRFVADKKEDGSVSLKKVENKSWRLAIDLIRHQDYYPDPTGRGLYELQVIDMDWSEANKMAEAGIYDKEAVKSLMGGSEDDEQRIEKARETNQNTTQDNYRRTVRVTECWGNLIHPHTGEILFENVTWSVGDDKVVLRRPTQNPFWHQKSPYVSNPIVRVPHSVWHIALMDAPTKHNIALNELFNLLFDSGMMATYGIKQVRTAWLEDPSQISNGVQVGSTIAVNSAAPVGAKVIERVDTASMSQEGLGMFQLANAEFNQSALTNDLRMGILPARQVKATEIVEASQSITSVLTGTAKSIETGQMQQMMELAWYNMCQHMDEFDSKEIESILGRDKMLKLASMSPEERFSMLAGNYTYRVYGISEILSKTKDFRKLVSLLQTIGSSEVMIQEFIKKYSFGKFMEEVMKALDIDTDKIKLDEVDIASMMGGEANSMGMPDMQSQISQASSGPQNETIQSRIGANYPPQALSAGGG